MDKTVLVVDDEISILEPLSMLLEYEGFQVVSTTNGEDTFKKVAETKPDLILLDILMSGTDGRTICKQLKQNKGTRSIPVMLMSAHPTAKQDSDQVGADGFIAKPFETDSLIKQIRRVMKKTSL